MREAPGSGRTREQRDGEAEEPGAEGLGSRKFFSSLAPWLPGTSAPRPPDPPLPFWLCGSERMQARWLGIYFAGPGAYLGPGFIDSCPWATRHVPPCLTYTEVTLPV